MVKCSNPTCTHKAHKGHKKCFQCLVSNAKYMRGYRERRRNWKAYCAALTKAVCSVIVPKLENVDWDRPYGIPVSAPPAGKSLGVSGSNAAQNS